MRQLKAFALRLRGLFGSHHAEADFSEEIECHIAIDTDAGIRDGLAPEEARRRALLRLGGAELTKQVQRERRSLPWLESLLRDTVYGLRTLAKHRGATAISILSIGLGIGANATIFSMVSRFVLRPAPVGDPTTLLALHTIPGGEICCSNFAYPMYLDVRDEAKSFSGVAGYDDLIPASIAGSGEPERVFGQAVTSNFFEVAQIPMLLGRGFINGEDRVQEIVLGAALWQRSFSADPAIIGKTVSVSGHAYTVIGVATPAFHSIDQVLGTEFWVPIASIAQLATHAPDIESRNNHWIDTIARLKPGVTREQAASELDVMARRFSQGYPKTDKDIRFIFEQAGSLPPRDRGTVLVFFTALSVVVLLVLCIAGANVANLLFAQAATRQRDMAVRLAVGATPGRLRRQMLIESLLLGLAGGVLGILLSVWSTHALSMLHIPAPVPVDVTVRVDWRVLLYSFVLSVVSGVLLGLAPAWAASRPRLASALKGEDALARPGRRISLRNILVIAQVAMSVVLLSITGLFLRSLQSAASIDLGFRTQDLLLMSVDPRLHGYTPERTVIFLTQLQQRVAAIPGVQSAVVSDVPPLNGGYRSDGFQLVGASGNEHSTDSAELYMETPGYLETVGTPLLAGSDFGAETATGPKVAVVNQAFAQRVFGSENPIGQLVVGGGETYRIIGVSGNIKSRTLGENLRSVLYRSLKQNVASDPSGFGYTLIVHTRTDAASLSQPAREQIHALDPTMAIFNEETMEEHVRTAYFLPRLAASLFGTFGFIGLVLAAVGLYGVMSYAVSRRSREIGIRMALGARHGTVERLVLRQGMTLTLIALALGWPAAWMLAKMASSFLYGIQPHDTFTFVVVPPFLTLIAVAACYVPARRAASIDPMQALRTE